MTQLGAACVQIDTTLEAVVARASPLTEYAWKFRYPGEPAEPPLPEAQAALTLARAVYDAVLTRLPAEVQP